MANNNKVLRYETNQFVSSHFEIKDLDETSFCVGHIE